MEDHVGVSRCRDGVATRLRRHRDDVMIRAPRPVASRNSTVPVAGDVSRHARLPARVICRSRHVLLAHGLGRGRERCGDRELGVAPPVAREHGTDPSPASLRSAVRSRATTTRSVRLVASRPPALSNSSPSSVRGSTAIMTSACRPARRQLPGPDTARQLAQTFVHWSSFPGSIHYRQPCRGAPGSSSIHRRSRPPSNASRPSSQDGG